MSFSSTIISAPAIFSKQTTSKTPNRFCRDLHQHDLLPGFPADVLPPGGTAAARPLERQDHCRRAPCVGKPRNHPPFRRPHRHRRGGIRHQGYCCRQGCRSVSSATPPSKTSTNCPCRLGTILPTCPMTGEETGSRKPRCLP